MSRVVLLRRAPALVVDAPRLDAEQRAVLDLRAPLVRVLGAPGTGKTTTAVELVVDRVVRGGLAPDDCLLLTSTRVAAARLRERVTTRLARTSTEALARTHQAFGFGLLRQAAALRGDEAPRLISGPEQDVVLRELLAGHERGDAPRPAWPVHLEPALAKRGFRSELRDLLMRAVEHGIEPDALAELGREHGRPEWVAAAQVLTEYDEVTAFSRPGAYDPAWILTAAADLLEDDEQARARVAAEVRLVVVDDAQELTFAAARLLRAVTGAGADLVLLGDPDCAVQTFRGADPRLLAVQWTQLGRPGAGQPDTTGGTADPEPPTVVLRTAYRQPGALAEVTRTITTRIGALGGGSQRAAVTVAPGGHVEVALLRSPAQEAAHLAARLRRAHLLEGVPWEEMAVIVRSERRDSTIRRVLQAHGVPVLPSPGESPVRDEVAVRPLLLLLDTVLQQAMHPDRPVEPERAVDLLLSVLGECDAVALRRLRRLLRREELEAGGERSSDELLAAVLLEPGHAAALGHDATPVRRLATAVAAGSAAAQVVGSDPRTWAPGVTAETVLWAIWESLDVGDRWRRLALRGGRRGVRADRDLDAVVALFDAAGRFVDRLPASGPDAFLEHLLGQDVPGDTLAAQAQGSSAVALLTPAAAAGREWRFVAVAGVQEGVWPDLRLRGSLLGSEELVAVTTGRERSFRAAQTAVRYDETRLFLVAVSRARERLLVTAVRSEDDQPSVYLDLVDPLLAGDPVVDPSGHADVAAAELRDFTELPRSLSLPSLVAELRRRVVAHPGDGGAGPPGTDEAAASASALVRLAGAGVAGADPQEWWVQRVLTDDRPLRRPDQQVRLSPSKVESFGDCRLRWALTSAGGDSPSQGSANLGTLIHDIAHELGDDVDAEMLVAEVERRWGRLGLPPGWATERQRDLAHLMATRLAAYVADPARPEKVDSEVVLRVDIGRASVSGRVDRLERTPDGLRVVDYKTGGSKPSAADVPAHPQLGTYQLAVEHGAFAAEGTTSAGAVLLHLGKAAGPVKPVPMAQVQPPLAQHEPPDWAERLVADTADGMGGARFPATPGSWCTFCPVRTSCPAQPEGDTVR